MGMAFTIYQRKKRRFAFHKNKKGQENIGEMSDKVKKIEPFFCSRNTFTQPSPSLYNEYQRNL
jgi:hypothetical protein